MQQIAILHLLRRHVPFIIALTVAATVAGYGFSFLLPERYSVSALMLVRPQQPVKMGANKETKEFLDFPIGASGTVETAAKTYIEIMNSPALLGEVVRELELDKPDRSTATGRWINYLPGFLRSPAEQLRDSLKYLADLFKYGRVINPDPFAAAVKDLTDGLSLKSLADTYSFEISYTATNPERAAWVVNATAAALIRFVDKLRLSEASRQLESLKGELQQKRARLIAARERLERYKATHSTFLPDKEYDSKLKVISELEVELAKTDAKLGGNRNTLSTLSLAAQRSRLVRLIDERRAELTSLPGIERELKQLDQDITDASSAYEIVEKGYGEAELKLSYGMPEVQLVSKAVPPRLPSSPKRAIIAMAAAVAGLTVAVGLLLLLDYMNRRVRGVDDLQEFVGLKVIATIPEVSKSDRARAGLL